MTCIRNAVSGFLSLAGAVAVGYAVGHYAIPAVVRWALILAERGS